MTARETLDRWWESWDGQAASIASRSIVGDRAGLVVFLGTVVLLGGLWRIDFLLNDSVTVANLLVNVADGHLAVTEAPYALTAAEQPGLVEVDGQLYGRNYGQVYLAVPVLWLLDGLAGVVDLRLLLAAGWSLAILGLGHASASAFDREALARIGTSLALLAFGASVLLATEIGWHERPRPVIALGLSTLLLAAFGATTLYRLLSWAHGRQVGLAAGAGLVLATPIGFWGSFPKRHVLSATGLLVVVYLFAVSRTETDRRAVLARAGAYGTVGFLASVHAFEAAFALAVLLPLDLFTAPSNDRRTLAVVLAIFLLSLAPMLVTNAAISGDLLQPPRTLPGAEGGLSLDPAENPVGGESGGGDSGGGSAGGGTAGGGSAGGGSGGETGSDGIGAGIAWLLSLLAPILDLLDRVVWIAVYMIGALEAGLAASTELERLSHIFVRSGWIPGLQYHKIGFETVDLAFLEVLPLAGALIALPVLAGTRLRASAGSLTQRLRAGLADPVGQTDLLVCALAATLVVVYLPRLPLYAMMTLRYIVPVMPLVLYAVVRLPPVRAAITDAPRALGAAYFATLAVGFVGYWLVLVALAPAQGEAVQLHAFVGLATALGVAAVVGSWPFHRRARPVAASLAVAAGATTLFLVFAGLTYFADGNHALDLVRLFAEALPAVG